MRGERAPSEARGLIRSSRGSASTHPHLFQENPKVADPAWSRRDRILYNLPLAHRRAMNTGGNEARRSEAPCRGTSDLTAVFWRRVALHTYRYCRLNSRRGGTRPGSRRLGCAIPFAAAGSPKARVGERCRAGAAGLRTAAAARVRRGRWAWGHAASSCQARR